MKFICLHSGRAIQTWQNTAAGAASPPQEGIVDSVDLLDQNVGRDTLFFLGCVCEDRKSVLPKVCRVSGPLYYMLKQAHQHKAIWTLDVKFHNIDVEAVR